MSIKAQGHSAFFAGETKNPYLGGTLKHQFWKAGWNRARKGARPLTAANFAKVTTPTAHNSGNPQGKLLASTSGLISALKTFRETDKSYYVTYYGEGDKEIRISKEDPRRRIFSNMKAAEAWAMGVYHG